MDIRGIAAPGILIAALLLAGCAGTPKLEGAWRPDALAVDGRTPEWRDRTHELADGKLSVGVGHDDAFLYVSLVTTDRPTMSQIMMQGLLVWIEGGGEKRKDFGVHYPLGTVATGQGEMEPEAMRALAGLSAAERAEKLSARFAETLGQIEIRLDPAAGGLRLPVEDARGIEARAELTAGRLACELKLPLRRSEAHPQAVGWDGASPLMICLETPQPEGRGMRPTGMTRGGMAGMGGRPGGMGGRPGGMGGRPGGMGSPPGGPPERSDPLEVWFAVELIPRR